MSRRYRPAPYVTGLRKLPSLLADGEDAYATGRFTVMSVARRHELAEFGGPLPGDRAEACGVVAPVANIVTSGMRRARSGRLRRLFVAGR